MKNYSSRQRGFGLVEAIVGISIISASFFALTAVMNSLVRLSIENKARIQASYLAEEGMEAVRYLRDVNWNSFATLATNGTKYDIIFANNTISSTTTLPVIQNAFSRSITLSSVYRDSSGVASTSASGGTLDPDSRFVTVRVAWLNNSLNPVATTTATLSLYLNKLF